MTAQQPTTGRRITYPVAKLRERVTALEEAVAQVLARPKKAAVHALRKTTRKIEAQLAVISALATQESGFRAALEPARRLRKLLKRVRRAAGTVRDMDVLRDLAKEARARNKKMRKQAQQLRHELKLERTEQALALVKALRHHALELEPGLEALLDALRPVADIGMSAVDLEVMVRGWYRERRERAEHVKRSAKRMHGVRKAAKLARYMAEGGTATRVVREFESLQEAGGRWHDTLALRDAARVRLGRQSSLAIWLKSQEIVTRAEFRDRLAS